MALSTRSSHLVLYKADEQRIESPGGRGQQTETQNSPERSIIG